VENKKDVERLLYRNAADELLQADNMEMPKVVQFKPFKSKPVEHKTDSGRR